MVSKNAKKGAENTNAKLQLVMKTGKAVLGYKQTLKALIHGKAKLILVATNTPPVRRSELEYYAMMSKSGVHYYSGNNIELGTACGKFFRVGTLAILDPGNSDIISKVLKEA
ncbi:hypothetical protein SNEBB_005937 [Seison nebaliae]|nr:hypothetical protein SNEBB_005937 [Seison nebaliae]